MKSNKTIYYMTNILALILVSISFITNAKSSVDILDVTEIRANNFLGYVAQNLPSENKMQSRNLATIINSESKKYKMDPLFVTAVIKHESRFRPNATGSKGEVGLMQIMPSTAHWVNKKFKLNLKLNDQALYDIDTNIKIGTAYLAYLKNKNKHQKDSLVLLSAYNMGPKKLNDFQKNGIEPKIYKSGVLARYNEVKAIANNSL